MPPSGERPVCLSSYDGHTEWAHSKAWSLLAATVNPIEATAKCDRSEDRQPTGVLKESR